MAWLSERCILAPLNETTCTINATLVAQISGESVIYRSLDSQRRKKILEAEVLRLKENSPAGGLGGCTPQMLMRPLEFYRTKSMEIFPF